MRAKGFTALLAAAVLAALAGWTMVEPISTGVYAQAAPAQGGRGAPAPGARGAAPPGAPGQGRGRGAPPPILGPPAGVQPLADRPVLVEELLQGPGELARQALLPLQRPAPAVRDVGSGSASAPSRRTPRRGATATTTGRASASSAPTLQDGEGTLRGAAGPGQGEGRPDRLHQGHRARLGRLLPPRQAGRPRLRVDLGRHAGRRRCSRC